MLSISDTRSGRPIELEALLAIGEASITSVGFEPIIVTDDEADQLRAVLSGSVIEADLQSLAQRRDGTNLLTGIAPIDEVQLALKTAGASEATLTAMAAWVLLGADMVAVHFEDGRM